MSKHRIVPKIQTFMTTVPHTIGADQTMARAHEVMREHRIRHLPVLAGNRLVGIVSDRDLHMVETLHGVDPERVLVEEAMTQDVYVVEPNAPLDDVVREMARHKYGSVVIADHGKIVGIFTSVDACRAFAEMLSTQH